MSPLRVLLLSAALCLWAGPVAAQLPSFDSVRAAHQPSDALLLDRHQQPLADVRFNLAVRRFEWVPLAQFSPALREALISAEDKRFFEHEGVDWKAFAGALWHNLWSQTKRGGSTLTMQLAGLLEPTLAMPDQGRKRRSLDQKWDQGLAAEALEKHWSKAQILEAYLNLAPFRGDLQGVHAASAVFFNKHPSQLDAAEAQLITALLPGPNARIERIARRACARARSVRQGPQCRQIEALAPRLDRPRNLARYTLAPHLARLALRSGGERVLTRLDATQQLAVLEGLRFALGNEEGLAYAGALLLDNADASVRAWVAGLTADSPDALTLVLNYPGAARPLAAALSLERRQLTAASLLPSGTDPASDWHSLRQALAAPKPESDRVLAELGGEPLAERLLQHGLETSPADPLALHANLAQLAQSLRSLVLAQPFFPAQWQGAETPPRKLWRADTQYLMAELLGQAAAHPLLASDDQVLTPLWGLASEHGETATLLQVSERYTLGVIVARQPPASVPPAGAAARALKHIAARLELRPLRPGRVPPTLVSGIVAFEPPVEAARREWFLRGTEMLLARPGNELVWYPPQILHPSLAASAIELGAEEIMVLEAGGAAQAGRWRANGEWLGKGLRVLWNPPPGSYHLELLGPNDERWDQRKFTLSRRDARAAEPSESLPNAP